MMQQARDTKEILSGVPEQDATGLRIRDLNLTSQLLEALPELEPTPVTFAPKPIQTHPETTPVVQQDRAGVEAGAAEAALRAAYRVHDEVQQQYPDFRSAA